ncbi:reverse transcriptase family protein, partial [Aspergillus affinis]|uniref:reverse transcriptase family protein n=1 Tax=Aspergillus affinis TaxID=1070780 RepID=UPI0022FDE08B
QLHLGKSDCFITSLAQIDKIIDEKNYPERLLEVKKLKEQIPESYHGFVDVFLKSASDTLPPRRENDHQIELTDKNTLGYSPLYRYSAKELEAIKAYLVENLQKGFIVPSAAPFGSPVLMAAKPGGGLRFCVDYRKLNSITKKNRYPLPLMDELLDRLGRAKIFTKLDIRQGFHRIRMHPDSVDLTTFRTKYGSYKYQVLPFGLTNGPAAF